MAKAVLISIRPEWCEKIARNEKTVEVRKTRPKLETPFKCHIYCTMDYPYISISCGELDKLNYRTNTVGRCNGKVIGEFTCDRIYELAPLNHAPDDVEKQACLTREEIVNYLKGTGYGWHISKLQIYDTPKPLSAFKGLCKIDVGCGECPYYNYTKMECDGRTIKRPPQSWCYVEEQRWPYVNLL